MKKLLRWRGLCGKEMWSSVQQTWMNQVLQTTTQRAGERILSQRNLCYKFMGNLGANTSIAVYVRGTLELYFSWAEVLPFLATVDRDLELRASRQTAGGGVGGRGRGNISPKRGTAASCRDFWRHSFERCPKDSLERPNLLQQCWANESGVLETSIPWVSGACPCWRHRVAPASLASCYLDLIHPVLCEDKMCTEPTACLEWCLIRFQKPLSVVTKRAFVVGIRTLSLNLTLQRWGTEDPLDALKLLASPLECAEMVQASLTLLGLAPKLRGHSCHRPNVVLMSLQLQASGSGRPRWPGRGRSWP
ncbi:uncharacterized protein LOC116569994 [Mustela erminea]|uniref:uncharacterized protein LOC116569994 n=1 Tax=Mustela erminea TaxID=36723 RepID=UPI0013870F27|nr:uncharacterized protein LOC116569994 [Mustela erminea]